MYINSLIVHTVASVRFSNASFSASEGQTPTICVEIFEGQLAEPAIVMISASSTLATGGWVTYMVHIN